MNRDISINGKNTWETWGIEIPDDYLDALLLPPPAKEYVENESVDEDGIRVTAPDGSTHMDSREVSIPMFVVGSTQSDFLAKFASFVDELMLGKIALAVPVIGKVFNLYYLSCSKYGSYGSCRSRITVKFKEPNPSDRDDIVKE